MKMRCKKCTWLNYDVIRDRYQNDYEPFCGLHGRAPVDPEGEQVNLDRHGSCGFYPRQRQPEELSLFDLPNFV